VSDVPAVAFEDVWFSYDTHPVVRGVRLEIAPGERVCMVGPNGGGKTTLLKLMLGLLRPDRGRVSVFGQAPRQARGGIGYAPQHARFDPTFPVNVRDVVLMGRLGQTRGSGPFTRADRAVAAESLAQVGLADLAGRGFARLSGGQRQRVLIARALASRPRLLLLDEPTANLDIGVEQEFHDLLAGLAGELTVVIVSHDIAFVAKTVGKVVCVQGTVAVHPTAELTGDVMRDLYGQDIRLIRHDHDCLAAPPAEGDAP